MASDDPAGTVVLYRKEDTLSVAPTKRLDPHSPALSECLLASEMLGSSPEHVLLVGIVGATYEPGEPLSPAVRQAIAAAVDAVPREHRRLGYSTRKKASASAPEIWWEQASASEQRDGASLL